MNTDQDGKDFETDRVLVGPQFSQVAPKEKKFNQANDYRGKEESKGQSSLSLSNPIKITFKNINFSAEISSKDEDGRKTTKTRQILNNVSGHCLPGEALFIMGSSGSGKTSLMNVLSDRVSVRRGLSLSGDMLLNDSVPLNMNTFGKVGVYVMQDDVLFAQFTPVQAIRFAARLKLKRPIQDQEAMIEELIEELGLTECQNTMVGSVLKKGISGGERKRTAIAVELVTNPSIIFLDEPTSGLDSFKALQIVQLLDKLAKRGKTVIATIHQPSSDAFRLFGRLLLMADGNIVYQGYAKDSPAYFKEIGAPVGMFKNPADHYMTILQFSFTRETKDIDTRKKEYLVSQYEKRLVPILQKECDAAVYGPPDFQHGSREKARYCVQLKQLMIRNREWIKKEPMVLKVKLFQATLLALAGLAAFWNLQVNNFQDLMNFAGCLSFCTFGSFMQLLAGTVLVFAAERPVFLREQANQMYSVGAYYQTKVLAELPIVILTPIIFSCILYFGIGLTITAHQYFTFLLIMALLMICSMAMGYFISSIFSNPETAATVYIVFAMPLIMFGGLLANSDSISAWISWFQYVSPIRFAFEAMMRNEFEDRYISSEIVDPIELLGFDIGMWNCIYALIGYTIFYRIMALIMLKVLIVRFQ